MYAGKRTERLQLPSQLRADQDLAEAVRFIARLNRRTIGLQILHWIVEGVEKDKGLLGQAASAPVTSPPQKAQQKAVSNRQASSGKRAA